jgi:colanic acid biosynthesis glycosyl transferase WcaI
VKLLVITNLFFPDRGGGASVFSDLCFGLAERNWEVTVYTTYPYYPEWRRKAGNSAWKIEREVIQNVQVLRHGLYIPKNPSRLIPRALYELSFGASLTRSLFRGKKYDAVMVYCPMLGAVLFASIRKFFRGEPLWLNIQDVPADAAAASGISQSGLFDKAAGFSQELLFNRADTWSTISPVMVDRLAPLQKRKQPLHLCPNWLNGSLAECIAAVPSKIGRPPGNPINLLYAGNIGKKQGLLEFCTWLSRTKTPFRFRICGNGGEANSVKDWVANSGDSRFVFGEFLTEPGFVQALHDTDVFVITEKPDSKASFIPSKLIPCISTGTPILGVCDRSSPLGREMAEAGLGIIVEWSDFGQFEAHLSNLQNDLIACQNRCLAHARNYTRDYAIGRFDKLLRETVEKKATST